MIDDSDVDAVWIVSMFTTSPIGSLIGLIALCIVMAICCSNKDECGKKHCDRGAPVLTAHECLCMEKAK